jgi:hypothetical protein
MQDEGDLHYPRPAMVIAVQVVVAVIVIYSLLTAALVLLS